MSKPLSEQHFVVYSFRADPETVIALRDLEAEAAALGAHARRRRSMAIRRAILEAQARLKANSKL